MEAINKRTGAEIRGTLELLQGRAEIEHFRRGPDGKLEYEHEGGTVIFYDASETKTDDNGSVVFLDDDGEEVLETDVILVEPEKAKELRAQVRAAGDLSALRRVVDMVRRSGAGGKNTKQAIDYLQSYEEAICANQTQETNAVAETAPTQN